MTFQPTVTESAIPMATRRALAASPTLQSLLGGSQAAALERIYVYEVLLANPELLPRPRVAVGWADGSFHRPARGSLAQTGSLLLSLEIPWDPEAQPSRSEAYLEVCETIGKVREEVQQLVNTSVADGSGPPLGAGHPHLPTWRLIGLELIERDVTEISAGVFEPFFLAAYIVDWRG